MAAPGRDGKLGTFAGVFTPSIMTILGIILFMRLGFVVGNAGLGGTLVIIAIATTISVLTSLSLSAIATNMEVRGGGDYYLISRTLGIEMGGAIGIVLYLAQSVSVAFYSIGFGEVMGILTGREDQWFAQLMAAAGILVLFVLAWFGTNAATRFQYVVMVIMSAALISFYIGAGADFEPSRLIDAWDGVDDGLRFWVVFAIFFPAVTGFTQGVSMSGELRDPARSLPAGTFSAVGLSTVVYISVAILLAGVFTVEFLVENTDALNQAAIVPWLVDAGVITATLSSAMASLMGAPRILQSLSRDRIFPVFNWFSVGAGSSNNPRRALILSLVIALAVVSLGDLDVVAPIVSMFFLISYGLLNYATAYEASSGSPSFRPRFRFFDRRLSWLGAALCVVAMLAVNPTAAAVALALLWGIHRWVSSRPAPERWSDAAYSHYFQRVNENIRSLARETQSDRHWRPQIIAFVAETERGGKILRFTSWIEGEAGMSAAIRVVTGEGALKRREAATIQTELQEQIRQLGASSHARVVVAPTALGALPTIVQSFGVGPLKVNMTVMGWAQDGGVDAQRRVLYGQAFMEVLRHGANGVTVMTDPQRWERFDSIPKENRRVDVWWNGDDASRLALLSAYLLTRHDEWSKSSIRLLAGAGADPDATRTDLLAMLAEARIDASIDLVEEPGATSLVAATADAAIVLVTMNVRRNLLLDPFGGDLYDLMERLPLAATFATRSAIDLSAGPESGRSASLVATEERIATGLQRLRRLEDGLEDATKRVAAMEGQTQSPGDLEEARRRVAETQRRILIARANIETLKDEAQRLKYS